MLYATSHLLEYIVRLSILFLPLTMMYKALMESILFVNSSTFLGAYTSPMS